MYAAAAPDERTWENGAHRKRWFAGRAPCAKRHAEFRDHKTTALKKGTCAYAHRWHLYR
jgi:hypothetical protein